MTSSTWNCEIGGPLIGVGIDAESVARFVALLPDRPVLPLVFSGSESAHCDRLPDASRGYCAAFCAKEAFFKATRVAMDPRDCRLLWEPGRPIHELELAPDLATETGAVRAMARVSWVGQECVVEVCVIGRGG